MKIYVMCEPSKFSKLQTIQELHSKAAIKVENQNMIYHFFNILMPVFPAVLDNIPCAIKRFKDITTIIIRYL
ncbi:hypothetical protein [Clostridium drakei]|uniref:Uncharacterized protein n=1 Tax=Clostridium drakei TaxID=332101 RepID=A0A2U8DU23_9CLOT|nr:hypothetical protein [Clostridium drakei]AWI05935.1 hypothetical protein B9W14_15975 [Clostridium drakei]